MSDSIDEPSPAETTPAPMSLRSAARSSGAGLTALAVIAFVGAAYVAQPVWMGLAIGTVMAFTSEPLYDWLVRKLRGRKPLAAMLTTVTGGLAGFAVISIVAYIAIVEIIDLVSDLRVPSQSEVLGDKGKYVLERLHIRPEAVFEKLNAAVLTVSEKAAGGVASLLTTTTSLVLTVIIAFFTMYYMLIDWAVLVRRLERTLPLDPRHTRALALEFRDVGKSAFIGTMGTSLVQGVFAATGYSLAGIPQPLLWGTVTMLASFLPVVGTTAVWIPIGIVTFFTGHPGAAVFTFVWGFVVTTGVADYIVRPRLVGSHSHIHPLPLLVSLLGGVELFGLMGVILGPILMSLCFAVLRIYGQERGRETVSSVPPPPPVSMP